MDPDFHKKEIEKLAASLQPAIQQMESVFNSPRFLNSIQTVVAAQKQVADMYNAPAIKAAFKQHYIAQDQMKKMFENINTFKLDRYGVFLKNTLYDDHGMINLERPSRQVLDQVEESIPLVEEVIKRDPENPVKPLVEQVKKEIKKKKKKEVKKTVHFNNSGDLWYRDTSGAKHCVAVKSSALVKLLHIFAVKGDFTKTEDLMRETQYASTSSFNNAIGNLNKKFKKLGFAESNAFEGKQSYGYRPHRDLFLIGTEPQ